MDMFLAILGTGGCLLLLWVIGILSEALVYKRRDARNNIENKKHYIELKKHFLKNKYFYIVDYDFVQKPKCDKCDENRRLHFINPLGQSDYVSCACKTSIKKYNITKTDSQNPHYDDYAFYFSGSEICMVYKENNTFRHLFDIYKDAKRAKECRSYGRCGFTTKKQAEEFIKLDNKD